MLEISNSPSIFQIAKNTNLQDGDIVQLSVEDDKVVLIKSNGESPIGFIKKVLKGNYTSLLNTDDILFAEIQYAKCSGYTDLYEQDQTYPVNSNLYVSVNGKLTTKRHSDNHPVVGLVIRPPVENKKTIQFLWY